MCDWALLRGARGTALAWAEAAARAWPANARFAWVAGKLLRKLGRDRDAELWLRRARRLALWYRDEEGQARALLSLGNLYLHQGDYQRARRLHERALRIARRRRIRDVEAMALHDLFLITSHTGRFAEAKKLGRLALRRYGRGHVILPKLAHDVACFWIARGNFRRALSISRSILPQFTRPSERFVVLAGALRSAGECGEKALFEEYWSEAAAIARDGLDEVNPASWLDIGRGALGIGDLHLAADCLARAHSLAEEQGALDVIAQAADAGRHINRSRSPHDRPT